MTNTQHSAHIHDDAKRRHAAKYGTANGLVAAWVPCILGFAVAGPLGAIGGALIGNNWPGRLTWEIQTDDTQTRPEPSKQLADRHGLL